MKNFVITIFNIKTSLNNVSRFIEIIRIFIRLTRTLLGVGKKADPVSLEGVGDPHLLPVDDEVVPDPPGGGLAGGHVTPTAGLAHSQTGHDLEHVHFMSGLLLSVGSHLTED